MSVKIILWWKCSVGKNQKANCSVQPDANCKYVDARLLVVWPRRSLMGRGSWWSSVLVWLSLHTCCLSFFFLFDHFDGCVWHSQSQGTYVYCIFFFFKDVNNFLCSSTKPCYEYFNFAFVEQRCEAFSNPFLNTVTCLWRSYTKPNTPSLVLFNTAAMSSALQSYTTDSFTQCTRQRFLIVVMDPLVTGHWSFGIKCLLYDVASSLHPESRIMTQSFHFCTMFADL